MARVLYRDSKGIGSWLLREGPLRILSLLTFLLIIFQAGFLFATDDGKCSISLSEIKPKAARAGERIVLVGRFEGSQGSKIPVINKGGRNDLEIESWSNSVIHARVPEHLKDGKYKVGVYCRDVSLGSTRSSGFLNFEIIHSPSKIGSLVATARGLKKQAQAPREATPVSSSEHSSTAPTKSNSWKVSDFILWSPLLLLALIIVIRSTQMRAVDIRDAGPSKRPTQIHKGAVNGNCAGTAFVMDCYSDDIITTEINVESSKLHETYEIIITDGQPDNIPEKIRVAVLKLASMGVIYLDVGFNTDRIAAETAGQLSDINELEGKAIARYLIEIKKILT